jgi:hypothetical protein
LGLKPASKAYCAACLKKAHTLQYQQHYRPNFSDKLNT